MRSVRPQFVLVLLCLGIPGGFRSEAAPVDSYKTQKTPQNALLYLHQVATHPRCANCHGMVQGDKHFPTVGEDRRPHAMGVTSALNPMLSVDGSIEMKVGRLGTDCLTCHQTSNSPEVGGPPGAANDLLKGFRWHMPPRHMAIPNGLTPSQLCNNWLDPQKNSSQAFPDRGGRDDLATFKKEFLDHHATEDPLVIWAWQPGGGRRPAPGSHALFLDAMKVWIDAGAPCP